MINIPLDGLNLRILEHFYSQKNWAIIISLEWLKQRWRKMSTALSKVIYQILWGTCLEPMYDLQFLILGLLGFIL